MSAVLDAMVAALWEHLALGPPPAAGPPTLRVDGVGIRLGATRDGRSVLATARAGVLSRDQPRRAMQVAATLRSAGAGLLSSPVWVGLDPREGENVVLVRVLLEPYAPPAALAEALAAVADRVLALAPQFSVADRRRSLPPASARPAEDVVILRP